ncbi:prolyl oligopeptidase family serine peptidase [Spirosoma linguale]|uniref:Peptidase S9 prolyl oligopeptidase active site domain protein n=1 Tax=Spirosoma linguale (strain ATCC 33905 / DSM 74 / LMG 10896 / Claus 1) TaxID=504472 RepID=D2QJF2_SPILD|nr:peptidase S9 prolyl oligopeptidase active site domain protein [Spirosoma linguale DSM 74]
MHRLYALFALLSSASAVAQSSPQKPTPLTVETIMQDPKSWVGTSPSNPFWSDDSKTLYFNWNPDRTLGDSLYKVTFTSLVPRSGRTRLLAASQPVKVSPTERRALPAPPVSAFNLAYTQRVFDRQGDLFLLDLKFGSVRQLTNTVEVETDPTFSGDQKQVIFRRSGSNLFSIDLKTGQLTQLTDFKPGSKKADTKLTDEEKFLKQDQLRLSSVLKERKEKKDEADRISKADQPKRPKEIYLDDKTLVNPTLSPDGRFVTYRLMKRPTNAKTAQVPNYITESGYTEEIAARTKVGAPVASQEFFVYDIAKDTVRAVSVKDIPGITDKPAYLQSTKADTAKKVRPVAISSPVWSEDSKFCVVVVRSLDNKDRWIMRLQPETLKLSLLDRQHEDTWIGGPGIGSQNSPGSMGFLGDNQTLWFQSEADGYSHLYTVNVLTGEKKQLTSGKFEVQQIQLSKDKKHFYLQTNEVHPGEQHFYRMAVSGGERTRLTNMTGANDVTLSPDETRMAIRYSSSNQPWELYVMEINQTGTDSKTAKAATANPAIKLTNSLTDAFKAYPWREPSLVTIPARDGQSIYARLYKPATPNGKSVVFVHGAGYLQNAHKWWSQYFREYMFHNLLADKGYTVLDIDYRASAGYGRDWRTGIYRYMGGKDLEDHVDAAKWLVQTQGVDAKRIGIYGGSYGGFITLMAMFTTPDVFKAGAALRPVTDWAAYNHPYTANILNEPQTDSLAYRRSSPINFAEGLKGHLLICHGMVDVNVHFQDAVRLAQRLIELKKENWELAPYPVEDHGFVEPTSWMDEYKRILKLFDERL